MGPNLKRLFAEHKNDTVAGERASDWLVDIFDRHGEALIEALERLLEENEDYIKINNLSAMGNVNLVNARAILALLEEEAKP